MTDEQRSVTVEDWLLAIREETRQAVLEGDAQDCSSADCIADAVYEIVRVALAALPATDPAGLDAAWAEVEAALPEGWHVGRVLRTAPAYEERWMAFAQHSPGPNRNYEEKHGPWAATPAAALLALASEASHVD